MSISSNYNVTIKQLLSTDYKLAKNNLQCTVMCDGDNKIGFNKNIGYWKYRVIKALISVSNIIKYIPNKLFNLDILSNIKLINNWKSTIKSIENSVKSLSEIEYIDPETFKTYLIPKKYLSTVINGHKIQQIKDYIEHEKLQLKSVYVQDLIILDENYQKVKISKDANIYTPEFKKNKHIFKQCDFEKDGMANCTSLNQVAEKALPQILDYLVNNEINILPFLLQLDKDKSNSLCEDNPSKIVDYFKQMQRQIKQLDYDKIGELFTKHEFYLSETDKKNAIYDIYSARYITVNNTINLETIDELKSDNLEAMINYLVEAKVDISLYINQLNKEQLVDISENFLENIVAKMLEKSNINYQHLQNLYTSLYQQVMAKLSEDKTNSAETTEIKDNINCYFKLMSSGLIKENVLMRVIDQPTLLDKFIELKMYKDAIKLLNLIRAYQNSLVTNDIKNYLLGSNNIFDIFKNETIEQELLVGLLNLFHDLNFNLNDKDNKNKTILDILSQRADFKRLQEIYSLPKSINPIKAKINEKLPQKSIGDKPSVSTITTLATSKKTNDNSPPWYNYLSLLAILPNVAFLCLQYGWNMLPSFNFFGGSIVSNTTETNGTFPTPINNVTLPS